MLGAMIPFFRHSWIFRSRWMALLWAAGICWMAVEIVGSPPEEGNTAAATTDVTGSEISPEDVKRVEETLKRL
jgi:hypothetical protein